MATSNELRVFISSTFRDLQEEREHLVKKIFPEIRALCRERVDGDGGLGKVFGVGIVGCVVQRPVGDRVLPIGLRDCRADRRRGDRQADLAGRFEHGGLLRREA